MSHLLCHQTYRSDQGKIWPVRRIVCPGDRADERNANFGDTHPEYQLVDGKWRRERSCFIDQDGNIKSSRTHDWEQLTEHPTITEIHDIWFEEMSKQ